MEELPIIGADLAKRVYQVYGADREGHVLFRKKLGRPQFIKFLSEIPAARLQWRLRDGPSLGTRGGKCRSLGSPYPAKLYETIREAAQE